MITSHEGAISWFASKETLSDGAKQALFSSRVSDAEATKIMPSEDFYYRLGHPRRGLEAFPQLVPHPVLNRIASATRGSLTTDYNALYGPINEQAEKFIDSLEDRDVRDGAKKGLERMQRLAQIMGAAPLVAGFESTDTEYTITRVSLLGK